MAFRRGERRFDASDDSVYSNSEEEPECLEANKPEPNLSGEEPPIHLALTDFGPQSLNRFILERLENINGDPTHDEMISNDLSIIQDRSISTHGNPRDTGTSSKVSSRSSPVFLANKASSRYSGGLEELSYPSSGANRSVHKESAWGKPLPSKLNTPNPHHVPIRRESSPGTTTSPSPPATTNREPMNFEEHTKSVRSRIRPRSTQASQDDPDNKDQEEVTQEIPSRRRKTGRILPHLAAGNPSSSLAETRDEPVSMCSSRSLFSTTDDDDEDRFAVDFPSSLDFSPQDSDETDIETASAYLGGNASSGSDENQINHDVPERFYLNSSTRTGGTARSHYKTAKGPLSIDYSRYIPAVAPRYVKPKRKRHSGSKSKTAPTTPEGPEPPLLGKMVGFAHDQQHGDLLGLTHRWTKSSKTKYQARLDMIYDPSTSTWTPQHPGMDPSSSVHSAPRFKCGAKTTTLSAFNYDIWCKISEHLSAADLKRLRLVNHIISDQIAPLLVRSVVTEFGKRMFHLGDWDGESAVPHTQSVLAKYGKYVQKFGVSFDYDLMGLSYPSPKVFSELVHAWFGDYEWPVATYPRFPQLQELEDLVDCNRPLLKDAFTKLTGVSELALSLDSGHGWLEGPDMSDLALFEAKRTNGSQVFGETFSEDIWDTYTRNEYFKWAQQNSINAALQRIAPNTATWRIRQSIKELSNMQIRDYDSFCEQHKQYDFNPNSHTGGQELQAHTIQQQVIGPVNNPLQNNPQGAQTPVSLLRSDRGGSNSTSRHRRAPQGVPIPHQWPLIFNCHNLAADVGGRELVSKSPHPVTFPLIPGHLTELQVQWLMETLWAQRAFLSSYTTAIITNKSTFRNVHTLTIAKLSSGLLPSLTQHEFWTSLTGLRRLKVLVKPDWRNEHVYGDKFHALNMPIDPSLTVSKFTQFLSQNITGLENLSHLTIGYFGGGEHASGMFARNTHILAAPITEFPRTWVSNHATQPDISNLLIFPHIRDLTFENCWFSPCMLESFMEKSRDTSLHTLVLDSVSMLSKHCTTSIDGPLSTVRNNLHCKFDEQNWLRETLPQSAVWTEVLNNITPGETMEDLKLCAGLTDHRSDPIFEKEFRGNITRIVLKSCGYCRISGVSGDQLNQNDLVVQPEIGVGPPHQFNGINVHHGGGNVCDLGIQARRTRFEKADLNLLHGHSPPESYDANDTVPLADARRRASSLHLQGRRRDGLGMMASSRDNLEASEGCLMMSKYSPYGVEYFGLGTLTQCIHPIEKRVLEKAWGMRFGWGDDMRRWESVTDGWLEGGTGRFSGTISAAVSFSMKEKETY